MLDPTHVRAQFPALQRSHDGQHAIYFDNPAGTQIVESAMSELQRYFIWSNANVGGAFVTSQHTDRLIAETRQAMADFLGAASPREIVFGQNMTSLTFEFSHAFARTLRAGDQIVTTRLEHDANVSPWLALQERGVEVRFIDIHPENGTLDLQTARDAISDRTRLVAAGYASNSLGTINDVRTLAQMAHEQGALMYVDAVHYAPHGPIDVQDIDCDFLVCSPYKFFGPHLGVLYGRFDLLRQIPSYHVRPAGTEPPDTWETGTQSHEAMAALLGTIRYLQSLTPDAGQSRRDQLHNTMARIKLHERSLSEYLLAGLARIPCLTVYGITDPAEFDSRVPTVSFLIDGHNPYAVARALGERNIFTWAGNHYAIEPLRRLGLEVTQRIGLVHYNTPDEIDRFLDALDQIVAA